MMVDTVPTTGRNIYIFAPEEASVVTVWFAVNGIVRVLFACAILTSVLLYHCIIHDDIGRIPYVIL